MGDIPVCYLELDLMPTLIMAYCTHIQSKSKFGLQLRYNSKCQIIRDKNKTLTSQSEEDYKL